MSGQKIGIKKKERRSHWITSSKLTVILWVCNDAMTLPPPLYPTPTTTLRKSWLLQNTSTKIHTGHCVESFFSGVCTFFIASVTRRTAGDRVSNKKIDFLFHHLHPPPPHHAFPPKSNLFIWTRFSPLFTSLRNLGLRETGQQPNWNSCWQTAQWERRGL